MASSVDPCLGFHCLHMHFVSNFGIWNFRAFVNLLFVCVEVLRPSQPNGVMSSAVSLPNHTFTGQA